MKHCAILMITLICTAQAHADSYELAFSTFLGGGADDGIRDVEVDRNGCIYVAGTTRSADLPTTRGAFSQKLDISRGKSNWGYNSDIWVAKLTPTGKLVWCTYVGGPDSEEAYGLEVDSKGNVVVHGRGASGTPVTDGVYQKQFKGCGGDEPGNPHNTAQNAYICKLSPDGSTMVWGSFFGIDHLHRDMDLDANDDIYTTWGVRPDKNKREHWDNWMKPEWSTNAFQPRPRGSDDTGVAKIASDGSSVIWATYLGGSDYDSIEASIRVDQEGYVYVGTQTRSKDIPTTPGAHDRTHNGEVDWYVCKLSPDGSKLIYGTFVGDEGGNYLNTHNLAVDDNGYCYSSTCAWSNNFPLTDGAVQTRHGGKTDWGIVKLTSSGGLAAATLLGGAGDDNPDGIRIDDQGNLVVFGHTESPDFPISKDAYQASLAGPMDAVIVKLSPNLEKIIYSTFLGGPSRDDGRAGCVGDDGSLILAGETVGNGWPVKDPQLAVCNGPEDAILAKLSPK